MSDSFRITLFISYVVNFFMLVFVPGILSRWYVEVFNILLMLYLLKISDSKDMLCPKLFKLSCVFIVINIFTCYFFRKQSPFSTLLAWAPLLHIFYYIVFRTWNVNVKTWEKVLLNLYVINIIIYIFEYVFINSGFHLVYLEKDTDVESRVRTYSNAILVLGYLYSLNKYLVLKKIIHLFLAIFGLFFIFLMGFRMLLAGLAISSILMLYKVLKLSYRTLALLSVSVFLAYSAVQIPIVEEKLEEITDRQENDNFDNEDYVRVLLVDFFYNNYFINDIEKVAGSGMVKIAVNKDKTVSRNNYPSEYAYYRNSLAEAYHFYPVDMGLIGLSWDAGIPFTIIFILIMLYPFRLKLPKEYYYTTMYGFTLVIIGFTQPLSYYHENTIFLALALVICDKVRFLSDNYHTTT